MSPHGDGLQPVDAANDKKSATSVTLAELHAWVDHFSDERDWEQFHTPKNLAMSIAIEAAEIMELYQWRNGKEPTPNTAVDSPVAEELADVLSYLLRMASVLKIDLVQALALKIKKNALKYPAPATRSIEKWND
jgi:NTP pyrophosphatase (non-canonical NTP hydrolase)